MPRFSLEPCEKVFVQQGAEAKVHRSEFIGNPAIFKERFSKKYRHPELDQKLTQKRMTQEARALSRCRKIGILTPAVYFIDMESNTIVLEDIENGITLKDHIVKEKERHAGTGYPESLKVIMKKIGQDLAKLHDADIIHGDLTSSNLIYRALDNTEGQSGFEVHFIDFGLSTSSRLAEDKGVDLYVLEKAFLSTHPNSEDLFNTLLTSYKDFSKNSTPVLSKYEEIKLRGRKRTMVG